jgi:hypothetical protein
LRRHGPRRLSRTLAIALLSVTALGACANASAPVDAKGTPITGPIGTAPSEAPSSSTSPGTTTVLDATSTATRPPASSTPSYPTGKQRITLDVGGTERAAVLVVPPAASSPEPLVVAFHGHGGSGANFARKLEIESLWPEAIVV